MADARACSVVEVHEPCAVEDVGPRVIPQERADDRPAELAAVLLVDSRPRAQLLREHLRCPLSEHAHQAPVDLAGIVLRGTEGRGVDGPCRQRPGRWGRRSRKPREGRRIRPAADPSGHVDRRQRTAGDH